MTFLPLAIAAGIGALLLSSFADNGKLKKEWEHLYRLESAEADELKRALEEGNVIVLRRYYAVSSRKPQFPEITKLIAKRLEEITGNPPR